jgi:hypothetical protein
MPTILCLAKSRKYKQYCIAGKDLTTKEWIRPVSNTEHGELTTQDISYKDGDLPEMCHTIYLEMLCKKPQGYQSENCLIDTGYYWRCDGDESDMDLFYNLDDFLDSPPTLWNNTSQSGGGVNDRVSVPEISKIKNSLYFIKPQNLIIKVKAGYNGGPKKIRGSFTYRGVKYDLKITDSRVESSYLQREIGSYPAENAYVTISLGVISPHDDFHYKLIAGIIF